MGLRCLVLLLSFLFLILTSGASAQSVLFDFDSAPLHSPLPIDLTVGGVTAHFSATGQGFSIQDANTMGFTPAGFAGYCIYPSSVFLADLLVSFSTPLSSFSILYAPDELACDSSATMRVTAYSGSTFVGTATMTAPVPGTWPSATLAITSAVSFDNVVVHYDSPPTCGDWGPIFMADNMNVTPVPPATCTAALFCDDFEDGILAGNWTYIKPLWTESGGSLVATPVRKAIAVATPAFAGCQLCSVDAQMETAGGIGNKLWLYGWYVDKNNTMELMLKQENNKIVLKQRIGGAIVKKQAARFTIDPNVVYDVKIAYDGSQFNVTVGSTSIMSFAPLSTVPSGTVGFAVKNTTGKFGSIAVN